MLSPNAPIQGSDIVKLNIGGTKYTTTVGTLSGSAFFAALLKRDVAVAKDEEGCIFVDRDGLYFGPLLSYLYALVCCCFFFSPFPFYPGALESWTSLQP